MPSTVRLLGTRSWTRRRWTALGNEISEVIDKAIGLAIVDGNGVGLAAFDVIGNVKARHSVVDAVGDTRRRHRRWERRSRR